MRISIRNQLATLVVFITLVAMAILSVASYVTNYHHFSIVRKSRLSTIASLKAAQLSSNLALMERSVRSLSTRARLQTSLEGYNAGNNTAANWEISLADLDSALGGGQASLLTLQTIVYANSASGPGNPNGLLNVTASAIEGMIQLHTPDGTVGFGSPGLGYPPSLYPNLTYSTLNELPVASYDGQILDATSSLLLGPLLINATFALISFTVPVINNTSATDILGYMTVVLDGNLLYDVNDSEIGLGETGMALILAPDTLNNRLPTDPSATGLELRFILPPDQFNGTRDRQANYQFGDDLTFNGSKYPAVLSGFTTNRNTVNNAGATLDTLNENGNRVGVGSAMPSSDACNWLVVVEYDYSEVWQSVITLRKVILACIFGTAAGVVLFTWPIAHFASRPIRRLRDATNNVVDPARKQPAEMEAKPESPISTPSNEAALGFNEKGAAVTLARERPKLKQRTISMPWKRKDKAVTRDVERGRFQIPRKVQDSRHFIHDELTDLTSTFNEMVDELTIQYDKLEERVRQRTAELETSKKAAEAANESKTLFIANISHELKTPLNGILGMCTLALNEDDPAKIKRSLGIIYKSGDLLHHLLTDLLTFSKHQAGKNLSLDEKQFRLGDIGIQLQAIFQKQAADGQKDLTIEYRGPREALRGMEERSDNLFGPENSGKVEDMVLYGDSQRILQVLINLISNSLKFTPGGGKVSLQMRCGQRVHDPSYSREPSLAPSEAKKSKAGALLHKLRGAGSSSRASFASSSSDDPPDPMAPTYSFEFEVEDTGPGIPKHLQSQIFEPFVQGDLRLTKKFGGTGLGLSICSQLSHLMKGRLDLKSEVGVGSTFTLCIPLRLCKFRADSMASSNVNLAGPPPPTRPSTSSPGRPMTRTNSNDPQSNSPSNNIDKSFDGDPNPRLVGLSQPYFSTATPPMASPGSQGSKKDAKLKVLVAEDNVLNAEIVTRMLKLEDVFDVTLAKDGQEALDKVKESMERAQPYDLIFMDVQMPILDGRQSTRLIREAGYSAPIVALTAFSDEINQRECLDSGMDYFLAKPIKRPALKHVLKTYCTTIPEGEESEQPSAASPKRETSEKNPFANIDAEGIDAAEAVSPSTITKG